MLSRFALLPRGADGLSYVIVASSLIFGSQALQDGSHAHRRGVGNPDFTDLELIRFKGSLFARDMNVAHPRLHRGDWEVERRGSLAARVSRESLDADQLNARRLADTDNLIVRSPDDDVIGNGRIQLRRQRLIDHRDAVR